MRVAFITEVDWLAGVQDAAAAGVDLICLPLLSFGPYVADSLDRGGYEKAERAPSPCYARALEAAEGAWLAASSYESEGEGVFYVTGRLGRAGQGERLLWRQRYLDQWPGRYEPMFSTPGHLPAETIELKCGPVGMLLGGDLRSPEAWLSLSDLNVRAVVCATADPGDLWDKTSSVAASMALLHGFTVLVANRGPDGSAGVAFDPRGEPLDQVTPGIVELEEAA